MGNNICGSCYYFRDQEFILSTGLPSINIVKSEPSEQESMFLEIATPFRLEISKDHYKICIYENLNRTEETEFLVLKTQECETEYAMTLLKLGEILKRAPKQQLIELLTSSERDLLQHLEFIYFGTLTDQYILKRGKKIWNDKTIYEGDFVEDVPSGFGKLIFVDNSMYEGEFKGGEMHGHGTLVINSNCVLTGKWDRNLKEGDFEVRMNDKSYMVNFRRNVKVE